MKLVRSIVVLANFWLVFNLAIVSNPASLIGQTTGQQRPTAYWPEGVECDRDIPTPSEFLGFRIGQRHLEHAQLTAYMKELARVSDRIQWQRYGTTHGGRPLQLLTITSPDHQRSLEDIRKRHRRLSNPSRVPSADISDLPAVINMGYGVHGDEASASNCAALVAYYLAAAKGEEIERWLTDCVILLDPCLNPDGFNRFANWVNAYRGRLPNDDPQHAEHNQSWPAGRVNYYWFDLNRDWLPLQQPESRSRMRWYHRWKPNVVLDFHEMGTNATYFFQPGVPKRTNPLTPAKNIQLTKRFAGYHAKALDARGSLYYTQERFDDFYMGKGSTYPDLHGAVGILFEQASARGHVQRNQDGRLRFHDAIANHFSTSLSSLRATSDLRRELLEYQQEFYAESLARAKKSNAQAIVFTAPGNFSRLRQFADILVRHDIRCYWPKQRMELQGEMVDPRAALIVPTQQPEYRFLESLLTRQKDFAENIFYDVSAWTLSLAFDLDQRELPDAVDLGRLLPARLGMSNKTSFRRQKQAVAYVFDPRDDASPRLLQQLLRRNLNVKVAMQPFEAATALDSEGETKVEAFDYGTLMVPLGIQSQRRSEIEGVLKRAAEKGVAITPVISGLTPTGIDLGSDQFRRIDAPKLIMPVGSGVSQYAAGEIWHLLDVRQSIPVTMVNTQSLGSRDLSSYTALLLPSGSYRNVSTKDWERIENWIRGGGTAIASGASCQMIFERLNPGVSEKKSAVDDGDSQTPAKQSTENQLPFDSAARTRALKLISGAIFQTKIDRTHPLYFGYESDTLPVFRDHARFLSPSENPYCNPAIYDAATPHLAGYCSAENIEQIAKAAGVVVRPMGRGRLIQISDNPNFRAFWHGTSRMYLNAIFYGKWVDPR